MQKRLDAQHPLSVGQVGVRIAKAAAR